MQLNSFCILIIVNLNSWCNHCFKVTRTIVTAHKDMVQISVSLVQFVCEYSTKEK
jgi:hypothetical protein